MTLKKLSKYIFKVLTIIVTMGLLITSAYAVEADSDDIGIPKVSWNGKEASWTAVEGADKYKVKCAIPGGNTLEKETTELKMDFTAFINENGSHRYVVQVKAVVGGEEGIMPGQADKYFYIVEVSPLYKTIPYGDYYSAGTDGGTVAVTATSGETFAGPDENGKYNAILGEGDKVTITASPKEGFYFKEYAQRVSEVVSTDNPYTFEIGKADYIISAHFLETMPDPITVEVEMGKGHETLAKSVYNQYLTEYSQDIDTSKAKIEGTVLTLIFPALNEYGNNHTVVNGAEMIEDLVEAIIEDGFDNDEYFSGTGFKPIEEYKSEMEVDEDYVDKYDIELKNNDKFYLLWYKPINSANITIKEPLCGTEVSLEVEYEPFGSSPKPEISIENDVLQVAEYQMDEDTTYKYCYWNNKEDKPFSGKIIGGEKYKAFAFLRGSFGYYIKEDAKLTVNGKEIEIDKDYHVSRYVIQLNTEVTAIHDFSEWKTVKEPTITEDGLEERVCSGCNEKETEVIPALGSYENTKGNNATWTKGSTDSLEFVFKNNKDDTKTFGNFVGIKVDGKDVDKSKYDAVEGSVVINLKPSYLETLPVGKHTLTAIFEDGQSESTFTIVEKSTPQSRTYVTPKTGVE